jgi:hypothetical protein
MNNYLVSKLTIISSQNEQLPRLITNNYLVQNKKISSLKMNNFLV